MTIVLFLLQMNINGYGGAGNGGGYNEETSGYSSSNHSSTSTADCRQTEAENESLKVGDYIMISTN